MIKRAAPTSNGTTSVAVTFSLPLADFDQPVSVVGEFNGWDPFAHPLRKRSNGTRSAKVDLPAGSSYRFKYLAGDGTWICDPEAETVPNDDHGTVDSVVHC
jgi:1,4-alpha-glucan branching enzyme